MSGQGQTRPWNDVDPMSGLPLESGREADTRGHLKSARNGLMQCSKTVPFATPRRGLDKQPRVGLRVRFFQRDDIDRPNCSSMGRTDPDLGISYDPNSKLGREKSRRTILTLLAGLPIGRSPP